MKLLARSPRGIGHAIRRTRRLKRLSQQDLSSRSGVRQETISRIETNTGGAKLATVFNLLAALDLELIVDERSKGKLADLEDIF